MNEEDLLQELENLAAKLALNLRYEKGDFQGGFYRYKEKQQIVINKDLSTRQKVNILARELKAMIDLENFYLLPALREVIENASDLD